MDSTATDDMTDGDGQFSTDPPTLPMLERVAVDLQHMHVREHVAVQWNAREETELRRMESPSLEGVGIWPPLQVNAQQAGHLGMERESGTPSPAGFAVYQEEAGSPGGSGCASKVHRPIPRKVPIQNPYDGLAYFYAQQSGPLCGVPPGTLVARDSGPLVGAVDSAPNSGPILTSAFQQNEVAASDRAHSLVPPTPLGPPRLASPAPGSSQSPVPFPPGSGPLAGLTLAPVATIPTNG